MLYVFLRKQFPKEKIDKIFSILSYLQNLHILLFDKRTLGMYNTRIGFVRI